MKNTAKLVFPFILVQKHHEEIFHVLCCYSLNSFVSNIEVLKYIRTMENVAIIDKQLDFKIKDFCNLDFVFTEQHIEAMRKFSYKYKDDSPKNRFDAWLYFVNLFCGFSTIKLEYVFYHNEKFRSEGNY